MAMRRHVFGFGTMQVVVTSVLIIAICKYFGLSTEASIIIGASLALSSTAIVMKVIADANSNSTQVGRLALANLLLQDLAVVPLLVLVPILAQNSDNIALVLGMATLKASIALVVIFFLGRMLLRPLFDLIASTKSSELFVTATLFVVLATSYATSAMGLSLAIGAFVAGLLVAETQYQHQVEDSIIQFKGLLMGLFFMTVGMTIDLNLIYEQLALIIGLSFSLIALKAIIIIAITKLFGFSWGSSIHAGLLLAQGGEFAFIVFNLASSGDIGLLDSGTSQILLTVVTTTMAFTPALSQLGEFISNKFGTRVVISPNLSEKEIADINRHVIIAGFGRTGEMVARLLAAEKVSYIAIDADMKIANKGKEMGFPVYHGDSTRISALKAVGIERAKAVIVTMGTTVAMKKTIRSINKEFPDIPIVVKTEDLRNLSSLEKIGATVIVPEKYEAGLQMAGALLKAIGVTEYEVSRLKNRFRAGNYKHAKEVMPQEEDK
jgi:monovalent cation:H+ antiporter-2, CPA2 family